MEKYYLGIDIGGSKTHALIATGDGKIVSFASGGPGNPFSVSLDGMKCVVNDILKETLTQAGLKQEHIAGAGFGIAGYDWKEDREPLTRVISSIDLQAPFEIVNDAVLGLLAGTRHGWGVAVVSGTGCNAWGWNRNRSRIGHVTGGGVEMGEFAGASELIFKAQQAIAHSWTKRGPDTLLAALFVDYCGAKNLTDLLAGIMHGKYILDAPAAPLVFQAAKDGDQVALGLIRWAGKELGEMAKAVIRQLDIAGESFDIALIGSMFKGSHLLIDAMAESTHQLAPAAHLVRLNVPPVVGAFILGMESSGLEITPDKRAQLLGKMEKLL